jgi:hypothetical protein
MVNELKAVGICDSMGDDQLQDIEDLTIDKAEHLTTQQRSNPYVLRRTVKQGKPAVLQHQADSFIPGMTFIKL